MATDARNRPVIHMVVAMIVLMVPVIAIWAWFTRYPTESVVRPVDYRGLAEQAAPDASGPLLVPGDLPDGWMCTRADFTPAGKPGLDGSPVPGDTWLLGFLTPDKVYVGLAQQGGPAAPEAFVHARTREGSADGTSSVEGESWTRYLSADGRTRSLVSAGDGVAVVTGDVPYETLESFASTLEPVD